MKITQLFCLLLCCVFCFIGCDLQETPTDIISHDVSSIASTESIAQTVAEHSDIESFGKTSSVSDSNSTQAFSSLEKENSDIIENEMPNSQVKEKKTIIAYKKWDYSHEYSHYIQSTESALEYIGFSMICTSYEDWCNFLDSGKVLYNVAEAYQEEMRNRYCQRYPKTYFNQGKSLLLFSIKGNSSSVDATVEELELENNCDLNVEINIRYPFYNTADVVRKIYIVEVENSLQSIKNIKVKANCLQGNSAGKYQQTETAQYVFPVQ